MDDLVAQMNQALVFEGATTAPPRRRDPRNVVVVAATETDVSDEDEWKNSQSTIFLRMTCPAQIATSRRRPFHRRPPFPLGVVQPAATGLSALAVKVEATRFQNFFCYLF